MRHGNEMEAGGNQRERPKHSKRFSRVRGSHQGVLFGYMLAFGLITLLGLRFLRFGTK